MNNETLHITGTMSDGKLHILCTIKPRLTGPKSNRNPPYPILNFGPLKLFVLVSTLAIKKSGYNIGHFFGHIISVIAGFLCMSGRPNTSSSMFKKKIEIQGAKGENESHWTDRGKRLAE